MQGCIHCGACTAACTKGALKMEPESGIVSCDESLCTHCNACIRACPARALTYHQIRRPYVSEKRLPEAYESR
ncbi:MAG TPA: 4Fe-4S dicluster domain-containing protein [Bacillota bacterium]|nr:4Fe-4S dicluster domain-containing protein [Bacillota bacterium]HNU80349.1 4Fe-4S dicluster domain-containing protein [Bacillota bacterium]HPW41290.1 4Fe-4S dicluster domain-containing protein [Bacillota bacterium]